MPDKLSITFLCPYDLEEKLLDLLLMTSSVNLFTSQPLAAHGINNDKLKQQEQVLGHSATVQIQTIIDSNSKEPLLQEIQQQFSGTGIRYWIVAALEVGVIQ